jgi:heme A synthase
MDRLAKLSLSVLIANLGVILWGAYVRASGSGAGCGNHWPLCNGQVIPHSPAIETFIELTHRITSGLALLLVIALVVATYRNRPSGDPTRGGSVAVLVFMLTEALVGAGIVLFELVVDDSSLARAVVMSIHLLNTFFLLGASTLTTLWAMGGPRLELRRPSPARRWILLALVGTLLVGASGAIAALGDTIFPSESLRAALQADTSGSAHWLVRVRSVHPFLAVLVGLFLIRLPRLLGSSPTTVEARRWGNILSLTVLVQLAAGALNIFLLVPIWLQLTHLALADAVWILLILYGYSMLTAPPNWESPQWVR